MSKSFSMIAASVSPTTLCAMALLNGSTSAGARGLFTSERDCAADVSSLCASYGWSLTMDTGAAPQIAALIGAASTIMVTFLTTRQQRASFPASSAARAIAWAGATFLYLIAINYIGGAILMAINWNGAYEDFGAVAFPVLVGGVFMVASIWATGRVLTARPSAAAPADRPSSEDKAAGLGLSPVQREAGIFSAFTIIWRVAERHRRQAVLLATAALHRGAVERHWFRRPKLLH